MAVEHAMFTFDDLKVTSRDDRMTDRMTTKVLSSRPRIKCGETNKQLKEFKGTWNSHPLRSECGFSPNQLWLQGLSECNFDCDIHIEYGAEDGKSNPFDMGRVEIP